MKSFFFILSRKIFVVILHLIDINNGQKIFVINCAACHAEGTNIIKPEKTLKKESLEKNGMNKVSSIRYQIINGKNAMPAFGGRLNENEIEDVAHYVITKSNINWE